MTTGQDKPFSLSLEETRELVLTYNPLFQFRRKYPSAQTEDNSFSHISIEQAGLLIEEVIFKLHSYVTRKNKYYSPLHLKCLYFQMFWQHVEKAYKKIQDRNMYGNAALISNNMYGETVAENTSGIDGRPTTGQDEIDHNDYYIMLEKAEEITFERYLDRCRGMFIKNKNIPQALKNVVMSELEKEGDNLSKRGKLILVLTANNLHLDNLKGYLVSDSQQNQISMVTLETDLNLVKSYNQLVYKNSLLNISKHIKEYSDLTLISKERGVSRVELVKMIQRNT